MVKFSLINLLMLMTGFCFSQQLPRITEIKSDHIRIDHYGQHDKPFGSFVITTKPLQLYTEEWQILVSEELFETSLRIVQGNKLSFPSRDENREFGIFKVTIVTDGLRKEYYFRKRTNSLDFFDSWLKHINNLRDSEKFKEALEYILSRIDYRRKKELK